MLAYNLGQEEASFVIDDDRHRLFSCVFGRLSLNIGQQVRKLEGVSTLLYNCIENGKNLGQNGPD